MTAEGYNKKDSPNFFRTRAMAILCDYMRSYHSDANINWINYTGIVYQTDFFKYSVIETTRHLSTHFYRYMIFEMQDIDSGLVIVRFPMPATHKEFFTIMQTLDVK